jgi:hypothetical protein
LSKDLEFVKTEMNDLGPTSGNCGVFNPRLRIPSRFLSDHVEGLLAEELKPGSVA